MTIELELPAYQSFIKQQEIKDGQPTGKLKAGPKKIRVPDTIFEKGRMIGWKWTERSPVSLLKMLPEYDPFASAEGYYFDTTEWDRIIAFIVNECVYPEGELTGQSFIPELWQSAIYANLFCWKSVETGLRRYRECFIYVPRKNGKELDVGTLIPTPSGFTTIGELKVGDTVFDKDGKPCSVVFVADRRVPEKAYKVTFSSGQVALAGADHQWHVISRKQHPDKNNKTAKVNRKAGVKTVSNKTSESTYEDVWTTQQLFDTGVDCGSGKTFSIPMHSGIECEEANLPIDPYILGAWLGDGSSSGPYLSVGDEDIDHWKGYKKVRRKTCWTVTLPEIAGSKLYDTNLKNNKHIPEEYFTASRNQRLRLLQGLMDTDGFVSLRGTDISISQKNKTLADGIFRLCYSLGLKATLNSVRKTCQTGQTNSYYQVQFAAGRDEHPVFTLPRKLNRMKTSRGRSKSNHIVSIEPTTPTEMVCIQVDAPSGTYLFGEQYLTTHNTTAFGAIITLIMFFVDSEKRSQNFCCAADSDQATVNFRHSQYMIENNPRLISRLKEKRVYRSTKSFEHTDGASFKVLSSVADTKHGLSPNFVYVDEVHAHPNSELVDVMKTGTAARRQPLIVYTTTADYDRPSVCNEMYSKAKMIASGKQWAPTFLPVIYEANVTDDFRNPTIWNRANPNYGKSITREYFEEMVRSVQDNPAELNRFLRLHLNIRTKTETAWIPPHVWANGNPDPDSVEMMSVVDIKNWMSEHPYWNNIACDRNFNTTSVDVQIANQGLYWSWFIAKCEELRYEECYAGFDNSIVQDLAALSLWFPTRQTLLTWHWCPAASIYRRSQEQGLPYARWWEAGLLNSTAPLETTDDESIVKTMLGDATYPGIFTHFEGLREICFDRFAMRVIYVRLKDFGYPARAYPQNFPGMNEPVRKMESMAIDKCLFHGGNPILEWEAGNVTIMTNHDGQRRPDKQKSTNKIDGIVASLMALGGSLYPEIETITDIRGLK